MSGVTTHIQDSTAQVTFDFPPVNALPSAGLDDLEKAIADAGKNPAVKLIVLRSEGRTFCAGASFDELLKLDNLPDARAFFMGFGRVILAIRNAGVPVVARVQGKAVGGGVGIAAASDVVYAVETAAFKLSELRIGIGAYVISPAIERRGGTLLLQRLSWAPHEWFSAFDVRRMGLTDKVFENEKAMDRGLDILAEVYRDMDRTAIAEWKKRLWAGTADWDRLLPELARRSAELLLRPAVKDTLQKLK